MMKPAIPIGAAALFVVGLLSGLPFRSSESETDNVTTKETTTSPKSRQCPATKSGSELRRALGKLATNDSSELQRMYDRELEAWAITNEWPGSLTSHVATRWAEVDPEGMFDHILATGGFKRKIGEGSFAKTVILYNELFAAWPRSNPHAAVAAAFQVFEHPEYSSTNPLRKVLSVLVTTDPELARAAFSDYPDIHSPNGTPPAHEKDFSRRRRRSLH